MLLAACQSETIARGVARPMPAAPHAAPPVPEGAVVNRIVFMVGSKPLDTDGNGFPDRIDTTVTLFAYPHPTPLWSKGRLVYSVFCWSSLTCGGCSWESAMMLLPSWRIGRLSYCSRRKPQLEISRHLWRMRRVAGGDIDCKDGRVKFQ